MADAIEAKLVIKADLGEGEAWWASLRGGEELRLDHDRAPARTVF